MKFHRQPTPMKAGDKRVLLRGAPVRVDFRVIAEEEYQQLLMAFLDSGGKLL